VRGTTGLGPDGIAGFSWRKSEVCEIEDETAIPHEYIKTTYAVDKAAVKKKLKNDEQVTGARLVEKMNLQVK